MSLIVYCTAALTSLSDSLSYITFLFSEWRIRLKFLKIGFFLCGTLLYCVSRSETTWNTFQHLLNICCFPFQNLSVTSVQMVTTEIRGTAITSSSVLPTSPMITNASWMVWYSTQ